MNSTLRTAIFCSVAFHGVLFFTGWRSSAATVDVERGPVSIEVALWSEAQLPVAETPAPVPVLEPDHEAWLHETERSITQSTPSPASAAWHGAFVDAAPSGTANRPPAYPWLARISGWEGTVVLRVTIEGDGRPSAVMVATSSGYALLDATAKDAIARWTFLPATRGGRPIGSTVSVPVRFRLTGITP